MTIDHKIRDEKLQYDIDREAAKTSTLSSGKINKYEYLIGEEILPSNQKEIIEQAKFTYSPLGKAFEKQIKSIEDHRKKQVEALNTLEPIKNNEHLLKYNEIFEELSNKRMSEIQDIAKQIDFNNLTYYFIKSPNLSSINFIDSRGLMHIYNEIINGNILMEKIEEDQKQFKLYLNGITRGNTKKTSADQIKIIKNVKNLYMEKDSKY